MSHDAKHRIKDLAAAVDEIFDPQRDADRRVLLWAVGAVVIALAVGIFFLLPKVADWLGHAGFLQF